ncbi:MAG: aromatic ring-hydroxylating dioxygenase subunit alpha, partial [Tolypothrix sp. Co-bin9]|nr:aromatic ring-hydroxylating dioxygenase subunit alpha [Tolypothrix sp. Co-bin9]
MYDRPYDQGFCIENLVDPAHFPISHHGSESHRDNAQPLEFEVIKTSIAGFRGRYRDTKKPNQNWIYLDFFAPNLILYRWLNISSNSSVYLGFAVYLLPLGQGRCRVLSRLYRNSSTWQFQIKPRWFSHLYRSRAIEEDMYFIWGAQVEVERLGQSLNKIYLPLKTSDTLVIEYRKWLDKYGYSLPFYQGYSTSKFHVLNKNTNTTPTPIDRLERHTKICSSCNQVYQMTNLVKQILIGAAIALAALAILTDNSWVSPVAVTASLLALALALVAQNVKTRFERPYTRH